MRCISLYTSCASLLWAAVFIAAVQDDVLSAEEAKIDAARAFQKEQQDEQAYNNEPNSYYSYRVHNLPALTPNVHNPFNILNILKLARNDPIFNQMKIHSLLSHNAPSLSKMASIRGELDYALEDDNILKAIDEKLMDQPSLEDSGIAVNVRGGGVEQLDKQPAIPSVADVLKDLQDEEEELAIEKVLTQEKEEIDDLPIHPKFPSALTQDASAVGKHSLPAVNSMSDVYFLAVVTGCSIAGIVGLIVAGVCWYRLQKNVKAASDVDYPAYGVTGPTKEKVSSPSDRKLAQSAQMYHYQHQKQQMIALEKAQGDLNKDGSDVDSEEENEEGDYTVFECPGLAPTGEMEVKNPLFSEDTPVTPAVEHQHHK